MQSDSKQQHIPNAGVTPPVAAMPAAVAWILQGMGPAVHGLRAQVMVIRSFVLGNTPRDIVESLFDDLDRELARTAHGLDTVYDYAQQAAEANGERGRAPANVRKVPAAEVVLELIWRALVEYAKDHPSATRRPSEQKLAEIITDKRLHGGKTVSEKTLSRYLYTNKIGEYPDVADAMLAEARREGKRLRAIETARVASS